MSEIGREQRLMALLDRALELEGAERARFLDRECSGDPALRDELDFFLREEAAVDGGFLESPALADLVGTLTLDATDEHAAPPPERLGAYRVVATLGQGGMGTVYLGEQEEPVQRQVALKVLDAVHSPRQRRRFAAECQALARLSHPNVASLYEVGSTDGGHPFVAMELVEGTAITEWCDDRALGLRQRIELFLGVCAGVRHAHEKGILHRDLKPSNVLVTEVDGAPVAKVIDFGIARAFDEPLVVDGRLTLEDQIVGSPAYMSPEAVAHSEDVDTRSDVYSLGLLLFELLAGVRPYELRSESVASHLRRLVKEDLPTPSVRFAGLDPELRKAIAGRRGSSPRRLLRRLRGDLDAIVARATARDRDERYGSPGELASDLELHLKLVPIAARPASASYRIGRFVRRRAGLVASVAVLILALLAGIVGRTREARRANEEAARANLEAERAREALAEAQEVSRFLIDLFEIADPERNPGEPVDARELLDRGAERLREGFEDQPLARARFLETIGEIYTKMALFETAETMLAEALAIREAELPADHEEVLESANQLGVILRRQGRLDEAEPLLRRVLDARESAAEPDPLAIALALNNLGNLLWSQRRLDEAEVAHRRALAIRERELDPGHPDLAATLNNLGALLRDRHRYEEAVRVLERGAEIAARTLGTEHPRRIASVYNLALATEALGRWDEAETRFREAITLWRAAYGDAHPRTIMARTGLGLMYRRMGREEESARLYREVLRDQEAASVPELAIASTLTSLGISLGLIGDFDAAQDAIERALAIYRTKHGDEHASTVNARSNLAWLDWRRGRLAEAERGHRAVLAIRERAYGAKDRRTGWTLHHLGLAIADQGRDVEAEPLLRRALAIREAVYENDHREIADSLHALGELARRAGRIDDARDSFERALAIRRRALPPEHRDLRRTTEALAALALGKQPPA